MEEEQKEARKKFITLYQTQRAFKNFFTNVFHDDSAKMNRALASARSLTEALSRELNNQLKEMFVEKE